MRRLTYHEAPEVGDTLRTPGATHYAAGIVGTGPRLAVGALSLLCVLAAGASAGGGQRGRETIEPSGLQPVFPKDADCPEIASPFGSRTRYDGSPRPRFRFGGYHGGIDLSLPEGTPLLALATGTVLTKGEGGQLEGIYLWLRHAPDDTGLPYWVYAKYQHLMSLPELPAGAKAAVGQVLGRSGRTGTMGGHYGRSGYPHLHLTTLRSSQAEYSIEGSQVSAPDGYLFDPVAIYHEAGPNREKAVAIPYMTADGRARPPSTRVVWPVACTPR